MFKKHGISAPEEKAQKSRTRDIPCLKNMEYLRLKKKRRKKVKNPNICYPLFCKRKCVAFQNIFSTNADVLQGRWML